MCIRDRRDIPLQLLPLAHPVAVSRLFRRLQGIRLVQSSDYYKQASELGPADMMPVPPRSLRRPHIEARLGIANGRLAYPLENGCGRTLTAITMNARRVMPLLA